MQLYVVTWSFQSAEYQTFATQALREYVDSGKLDDSFEGYEKIAWGIPYKMEQVQLYVGRKVQLFYIEFLALGAINSL